MTGQPLPLFGEDYTVALLLRMVLEHCSAIDAGELDSFGIEANADAMRDLARAGFIEIVEHTGERIRAKVLPEAEELVTRLLTDKAAGR
jgi:hypothetical protein